MTTSLHILDGFVRTEGFPEVVQFSGGEPTIHPEIVPMLRAAKRRNIRHVMLNTNGKRIANDDAFLAERRIFNRRSTFSSPGSRARSPRILEALDNAWPELVC